jgi:hypothetical protein
MGPLKPAGKYRLGQAKVKSKTSDSLMSRGRLF